MFFFPKRNVSNMISQPNDAWYDRSIDVQTLQYVAAIAGGNSDSVTHSIPANKQGVVVGGSITMIRSTSPSPAVELKTQIYITSTSYSNAYLIDKRVQASIGLNDYIDAIVPTGAHIAEGEDIVISMLNSDVGGSALFIVYVALNIYDTI